MKCALCKKDVRSHKREMIMIVNSGVLDVEPADVKQTMHKRCATHYKVAERLLISSGVIKPIEKKERPQPSQYAAFPREDWYIPEIYKYEEPKYNVFGERRKW